MTAARWASLGIALILLAPSPARADQHRDRDWDHRDGPRVAYVDCGWSGQYRNVAFNNGYQDGLQKGREDGWNRNAFDPYHHLWYRGASRGFNGVCSHEQYRDMYREGFRSGYAAGFGARPLSGYAPPPPVYAPPTVVYAPAPVYRPRAEIHIDWWRR